MAGQWLKLMVQIGLTGREWVKVVQLCLTLWPHGLYSPWNPPGQNTGVPFPFPGDLPNQGWNPGLLHCRQILYQLSHKRSPRILEWVAYPLSRGSSQPKIQPGFPVLQADSFYHLSNQGCPNIREGCCTGWYSHINFSYAIFPEI